MRRRSRTLVFTFASWLAIQSCGWPQEEAEMPQELEILLEGVRTIYDLKFAPQFEKMEGDYRRRYSEALDRAYKAATADADLEAALDIKAQQDALAGGGEPADLKPKSELGTKLLQAYLTSRAHVRGKRQDAMKNVLASIPRKLSALQSSLTKSGEIEKAIQVRTFEKQGKQAWWTAVFGADGSTHAVYETQAGGGYGRCWRWAPWRSSFK